MRISSLLASAALILLVSACGDASLTSSDAAVDAAQETDATQASTVTIDGTALEVQSFVRNEGSNGAYYPLIFASSDVQRELIIHEARDAKSVGVIDPDNPFPEANGREVWHRVGGVLPQYLGGGTFNGTNELTIQHEGDVLTVTGTVTVTKYEHDTHTFVNDDTVTIEFNLQNLAVLEQGPPPPAN